MFKYLLIVLLIAISSPALATDVVKIKSLGRVTLERSYVELAHYCHMNTVYLSASELKQEALAIVWNHDSGKPLKCDEYNEYIKKFKTGE